MSIRQKTRVPAAKRRSVRAMIYLLVAATGVSPLGGCGLLGKIPAGKFDTTQSYRDNHGLQIDYPDVREVATPVTAAAESTIEPHALQDPSQLPALEMSLEEAINRAVQDSPVIRSIGGFVTSARANISNFTVYDPGLTASSGQGTEAALSAFDAQYTNQLFWQKVNQPRNTQNFAVPGFIVANVVDQNLATFASELSKTTALGSQFALRHNVNYSRANDPSVFARIFPSDFTGFVEAEWRQPLLQGAGLTYNRIAGPSGAVGQYNGVLIARINEDVALTDFEQAVIQLVSDVEQAYWDLVAAYRVLDASVKGRESAQQTFQYQQVRLEVGSGRQDEEAQARSQFYQFAAQVETSLGGAQGLYSIEQRLRYLIGLPASDGRLIRPTTDALDVKVIFDWQSALGQSLDRRVEIRRQRFNVKRRELELVAARQNLQPRLDLLAQYRWRGLGDHLIGSTDNGPNDNLYSDITDGNYQEWQAGFEFRLPVGMRLASVAVANAKLNVKRERALLAETELRVSHDLSEAARQIELTFQLMETNYNGYIADLNQVDVLRRRYLEGSDNINFLLQAQRQVVTSETNFYRALTNYNLSIRDFHRQKGSLLAYNNVQLAEGPWAAGAISDAYQRGRFLTPRRHPEKTTVTKPLVSGPFDPSAPQQTMGGPAMQSAPPVSSNIAPIESDKAIEALPAPTGAEALGEGLDVESNPR